MLETIAIPRCLFVSSFSPPRVSAADMRIHALTRLQCLAAAFHNKKRNFRTFGLFSLQFCVVSARSDDCLAELRTR
jgi:hypothetical protein